MRTPARRRPSPAIQAKAVPLPAPTEYQTRRIRQPIDPQRFKANTTRPTSDFLPLVEALPDVCLACNRLNLTGTARTVGRRLARGHRWVSQLMKEMAAIA